MKKRVLAVLLVLCMVLSMVPTIALAEESSSNQLAFEMNYTRPTLQSDKNVNLASCSKEVDVLMDSQEFYTDARAAGAELRQSLEKREPSKIIYFALEAETESDLLYAAEAVLSWALAHTGVATQGDYLYFNTWEVGVSIEYAVEEDLVYVACTYDTTYLTTAEQEAQVTSKVNALIDEWNLGDVHDYTKVKAAYDYICSNVTYMGVADENTPALNYSAYSALIDGCAVNNGFSLLVYRFALELGVDCRIITGNVTDTTDMTEAICPWNIIKMDDLYYYTDASVDAGKTEHTHFLAATSVFYNYTRGDAYVTSEFKEAYPISEIGYGGPEYVYASGTCGDNATWELRRTGVLTISGTGPTYDFDDGVHTRPWNEVASDIEVVVIEEGITALGNAAFDGNHIKQISFPGTLARLGAASLRSSFEFVSISIPAHITEIGENAFAKCKKLEEIIVEEGNPNYCSVDGILYDIDMTELLQYPTAKAGDYVIPDSVTSIPEEAFKSCYGLTALTIGSGITVVPQNACAGTSITTLVVGENVTEILYSAFDTCNDLKEIYFTGPAPTIASTAFDLVRATVYYPADDPSYTDEVKDDYGGFLEWVPMCEEHSIVMQGVAEATCEEDGYTGDEICEYCGLVITAGEVIPALGHDYGEYDFNKETHSHSVVCDRCEEVLTEDCTFGEAEITTEATPDNLGTREYTCTVCGGSYEETYVCRISGSSRYDTGYAVADALKAQLGVEEFDHIIVASGLGYADALAASYLAAVKEAPILLVNERRMEEVAEYIRENLNSDGMIYLIGGESAVPAEMEEILDGFNITRLSGKNRYETNMAILEEAGTEGQEILICTGRDFPDSLSASAVGKPILLVNKTLYDYQKEFLENSSGEFVIIGGTGAVSEDLEAELAEFGESVRLGGSGRYETCVMVAEYFFPEGAEAAIVAYSRNFPDGLCGGPLAYAMNAPLLLLQTDRGPEVIEYSNETGIKTGAVLGGASLIDDATINKVFVK